MLVQLAPPFRLLACPVIFGLLSNGSGHYLSPDDFYFWASRVDRLYLNTRDGLFDLSHIETEIGDSGSNRAMSESRLNLFQPSIQ